MIRPTATPRDEHGQVLVMAVAGIMTFILLLAVVTDIGNWFVHRRHLQTQVDAAALAAGGRFRDCFFDQTTANTNIKSTALEYAGDTTRNATTFNQQVSPDKNVHIVLNSTDYWSDSSSSEGDLGEPCSVGFLDVKATDDDTPSLFGLIPLYPDIKAHARIKFASIVDSRGTFPFGIPVLRPQRVRVFLTDQCSGNLPGSLSSPIAEYNLAPSSAKPENGVKQWTSLAGKDPLNNPATGSTKNIIFSGSQLSECGTDSNVDNRSMQVGLVVAISGTKAEPICGTAFVVCYDASTSGAAVRYIRSWTGERKPDGWTTGFDPKTTYLPWVAEANLQGCSPSAWFTTTDCDATVSARINFGDPPNSAGFHLSPPNQLDTISRTVTANGQPLTCDASGLCTGGPISVRAGNNPNKPNTITPIQIDWAWELTSPRTGRNPPPPSTWRGLTCDGSRTNPCKVSGSFPIVLNAYRANPDSAGPIEDIQFWDGDGAVNWKKAGDQMTGSYVTVNFGSSLGDPQQVVTMRLDQAQGNQSLDCDPDNQFGLDIQEISQGCPTDAHRADPNAAHYAPNDLEDPEWYCSDQNSDHNWPKWLIDIARNPPWQCVRVGPGFTANNIAEGMAIRTKNTLGPNSCTTPDNWSHYGLYDPKAQNPDILDPTFNKSDPRIIRVFVVPYGSFKNAGNGGNKTVPSLDFAQFYVTDWGGAGSNYADPCPPSDPEKLLGPRPDAGKITGHLMRFDSEPGSGDIPGEEICDLAPGAVRPCIAVLDR